MLCLGPESRALLDEGRAALQPATVDRDRILAALRGRTAGATPEPLGGPSPPAAGIGWPVISGVVVGLAFAGALLLNRLGGATPADDIIAPRPSGQPQAQASPTPRTTPPEVSESDQLAPPARSSDSGSAPSLRSADSLAHEVELLSQAERELHAGRFGVALTVLAEHQRKFPRGILAQERRSARIQALCGLGRVAEADAELARVSPASLHGGRVREACAVNRAK